MLSKMKHATDQEESPIYNKLRNKEILLIDDDELIRDSLTLFFTGEGLHLSAFESAEKGLEALEKSEYDIIIVDYRLPGMDGVEFFKRIKETQKDTLKILITAYKDHKVIFWNSFSPVWKILRTGGFRVRSSTPERSGMVS